MKNLVQVTIESPRGTSQKYDFDPNTGAFTLAKLLPKGMVFPYDFGFIPGTVGEDGDPLDIIVLGEAATFTGCSVNCRIIGSLVCDQTERDGKTMRNDRYIGIPDISETYRDVNELSQLPKDLVTDLESFFITYNSLAGKKLKVTKRIGSAAALKQLDNSRSIALINFRIEVLVPLADKNGENFPPKFYQQVEDEFTDQFGGVTVYARSPVKGIWQPEDKKIQQDLLVYEVFSPEINVSYWEKLKKQLEKQFKQDEIVIIHCHASKIAG